MLAESEKAFELKDMIGIGALLVSVAAVAVSFWTAHRQRLTAAATLLTTLSSTFESLEMRQRRATFALMLYTFDKREEIDLYSTDSVLDFFEEVGHLVKRGVLDKEMAWNHFFWHLERYYQAVSSPVNLIRKARSKHKFPTLYSEAEWLFNELKVFREKRGGKKYKAPSKEEVAEFLQNEVRLIPPPPLRTL